MKYLFILTILVLSQTCQKVLTSPEALVTAIQGNEILFSDGTKQVIPMSKLEGATVFILVRHAEKEVDKQDPGLTPKGKERAERLANIFKDANLFKVYSTPYQRTINTALPTIRALDVEQGAYRADKLGDFIDTLLEHQKGKRFLIVGHSNTTPAIVNHLVGNSVYEDMDHEDYGTMYIVASKGKENSEVIELKY